MSNESVYTIDTLSVLILCLCMLICVEFVYLL